MAGKRCEFVVFFVSIHGVECACQDSGEPPVGGVVDDPLASLPVESGFVRIITEPASCHCFQWRSLLGEIFRNGSGQRQNSRKT